MWGKINQEGTRLLFTEVLWTGGTRDKPCLLSGGLWCLPWQSPCFSPPLMSTWTGIDEREGEEKNWGTIASGSVCMFWRFMDVNVHLLNDCHFQTLWRRYKVIQSLSLLQTLKSLALFFYCPESLWSLFPWHLAISSVFPEPEQKSKRKKLMEAVKFSPE